MSEVSLLRTHYCPQRAAGTAVSPSAVPTHSQAVSIPVALRRSPAFRADRRPTLRVLQTANESRMRKATADPALAYREGSHIITAPFMRHTSSCGALHPAAHIIRRTSSCGAHHPKVHIIVQRTSSLHLSCGTHHPAAHIILRRTSSCGAHHPPHIILQRTSS
ncbi:unnamed protein product [Pleuronectes platessa]|uniref:Uncharacterized protein n=1 Tax=Pleuronectes platessa TaxID=8262 RepID=A0A9N7U6P0_PLEPL|nr:unnamed protein product [Pleuronectes platessa]